MSKVTQLTDPVTKEKTYPVTTTDCVYLPNGESLTKHLNKSGLPLGLIISSAIVRNDAGLHLLDGSSLSLNGVYKAFCDYLVEIHLADKSTVPVYYTIQEYANDMNDFGQCGKFVYNPRSYDLTSTPRTSADLVYSVPANSIKLPTITKHIEGLSSISELGTALGAGLPNIEGSFDGRPHYSGETSYGGALTNASGAFSLTKHGGSSSNLGTSQSSTGSKDDRVTFDASKSNSIYGNSNTVQTQSVKYPYYIVVATTTKTDIEVDIDNIASDLNNVLSQINERADRRLSNVSAPAIYPGYSSDGADFVIDNYVNSDHTMWYRKYKSGWFECGGVATSYNNNTQVSITFPEKFTKLLNLYVNTGLGWDANSQAVVSAKIVSYSESSFQFYVTFANADQAGYPASKKFHWRAEGYVQV